VTASTASPDDRFVIHDVVLHMNGEQPLVADLFELPDPSTTLLRCTNLRHLNGKRPVWADDMNSVFFFPMLNFRFLEVPTGSLAGEHLALGPGEDETPIEMGSGRDDLDEDLAIDEDFLRRIREA
jgi:hypothetical protein